MSTRRKPSDRLTPDDFARVAVWTYDAARRDDDGDEPWVRPARAGDALDDAFVRATLTDRDGKPVPRAVLTLRPGARKGAKPIPTALVVLSPFTSTPIEGTTLSQSASPAIQRLLPIRWEVDVKVGSTRLRADGRITERPSATVSTEAADEAARRQALIEAALQKRQAEMAKQSAFGPTKKIQAKAEPQARPAAKAPVKKVKARKKR